LLQPLHLLQDGDSTLSFSSTFCETLVFGTHPVLGYVWIGLHRQSWIGLSMVVSVIHMRVTNGGSLCWCTNKQTYVKRLKIKDALEGKMERKYL
jgi:hypothetical protein